ncbi:MAG: Phosphoenolpyruvate synthase [candidate division TM6 bacterium GW2011_GWF2_37_49]|nr:MAG: Phosphoenolpyruvate synthase [candidate division TM6 bacterium GW2011_GWF2_37_49]
MKFIKLFEEIGIKDIATVGGKNASLGEMVTNLGSKGVLVPSGFAITAEAYWHHIRQNNLEEKIKNFLSKVDKSNLEQLAEIGHEIRVLIRTSSLPADLVDEIKKSYKKLEERYGKMCDVAVRSSATAEDLPEASFAGQQETFLNIRGTEELLKVCPDVFASLFTNRAISYRIDHNFDHMSVGLSIGVQKMVKSGKASSGVVFTLDTESGFRDVIFITSSYGLGENIVKGAVNPDEFYVHKSTLKQGFRPILKKRLGSKRMKMIYSEDRNATTCNIPTKTHEQLAFSIKDEEIISLAKQCLIIEEYYSSIKNMWCPMDIEWAKDSVDGKIYIVQARPETVHSQQINKLFFEEYIFAQTLDKRKLIITGKSIGRKIVSGKAKLIESASQMNQIEPGEILVTEMTDPDWEPIMKIAGGIVTNRGGRTCHAAIVSRELGIPAVIGTSDGTVKIKNGQEITLDCSSGEVGYVYEGLIPFQVKKIEIAALKKAPVDIMMNVGNPDEAFNFAALPNDGVGLARLEFIINNSIKIHPMALIKPELVTDCDDNKKIKDLTIGYANKKQFFIDKLAQEAGTIAAAFYPKPVIIRMSDFKSNEYSRLIGGQFFEPEEENPMIGFRGASRYYHPKYQEAFALECAAMKKIMEDMGLTNIKLMIPFVRTVEEGKRVIQEMVKHGLIQGKNGLEVYMMCEIPSNVLLIDQFAKVFDGFSIGSNDLTQTVLAVDRDSELISNIFDERNQAVKIMLESAIKGAQKSGKKIGICGQAPSDYPEIAEFLIKLKIDSISLNPDAILKEIILLSQK